MPRQLSSQPVNPFRILSAALLGLACSGICYWWPALQPGLNQWLNFTETESLALVALANSGSTLGIFAGVFHTRYGSKRTAEVGAFGLSLCFAILALRTVTTISIFISNFWVVAPITLLINMFSYALYASCVSITAAVFPERYRGRVVGLCSLMYGASAGMFGAIQAAFFPSLQSTPALLIFASAFFLIPLMVTAFVFPSHESFAVEDVLQFSSEPLAYHSISTTAQLQETHPNKVSISTRLNIGYILGISLVVFMQGAAIAETISASAAFLRVFAIGVLVCLVALQLLSLSSTVWIQPRTEMESNQRDSKPFFAVAKDPRYIYLCISVLFVVAGGGIAMLVQAPHIVQSRFYEIESKWRPDEVAVQIRIFVMIFSACNVLGRLLVGHISDRSDTPFGRMMLKYNTMHSVSPILSVGLLMIAVADLRVLYFAVGIIGVCHGVWFSASATLSTIWFGVHSFPRDFSILGLFVAVGSATLSTALPSYLMARYGTWSKIGTGASAHNVCIGPSCTAPLFFLLAAMNLVVYALGWSLKRYIEHENLLGYNDNMLKTAKVESHATLSSHKEEDANA